MKIYNFDEYYELYESLETAKQFVMKDIEPDTALKIYFSDNYKILKNNKTGNIVDYITKDYLKEILDYSKTKLIYYKDVYIGIITYHTSPGMLYVSLLEILPKSKKKFPELGVFEFVSSVLDWLILYCKEHHILQILCIPKTDLHKKLYKRAGFRDSYNDNDILVKDIK